MASTHRIPPITADYEAIPGARGLMQIGIFPNPRATTTVSCILHGHTRENYSLYKTHY